MYVMWKWVTYKPYVFSCVSQESPCHCQLMVEKLWMSLVELKAVVVVVRPDSYATQFFCTTHNKQTCMYIYERAHTNTVFALKCFVYVHTDICILACTHTHMHAHSYTHTHTYTQYMLPRIHNIYKGESIQLSLYSVQTHCVK